MASTRTMSTSSHATRGSSKDNTTHTNIALTTLPSYHANTTTYKPPSISTSTTTTLSPPPAYSSHSFTPTTVLQIQTPGKPVLSLPLPQADLTTPIFNLTTHRPTYLSVRPARKSGTCHLVLADDETSTAIARTEYKFGPGRPPVVRLGADDDISAEVFEMNKKRLFARTVGFEIRRRGKFVWRYAGKEERREAGAGVDSLLVLERVGNGEDGGNIRIAQLIRGEGTRAAGAKKWAAGAGGRLEMELGEKEERIGEVAVVVTCLVMLKKEVDRLRAGQIACMSGGACGGS